MQSQGSTSSQPSFDSLSSSDSLLLSDSEQAEDDADVFLTDSSSSVIIRAVGGGGAAASRNGGSESPGSSQWTCDGFTDREEEEEQSTSRGPRSQGDLLFAQKCAELQGFVRPLLELLNGLKRGRFDRGLSSFQQSVAMDRIQRIVGVLQRPNGGEKYLNTLLQVEVMLKLWFPQISIQPVSAASSVAASPAHSLQETSSSTPPHKHRDQLHIPVKKRRLSWTGTDSPTPSPVLLKSPRIATEEKSAKQDQGEGKHPPGSQDMAEKSQPNQDTKGKDGSGEEQDALSEHKAGQSSEPSLTWVHVAPILSPPKACPSQSPSAAGSGGCDNQPGTAALPAGGRQGSPATQDSSISSTTSHKHPKNLKKPIRCQSQPLAGQQREGENTEARQGQNQFHDALKPLPRPCPTPSET